MKILGLSAPLSWNNAAALVVDGRLDSFAEEERFTRIKHAPRMVPTNAIDFCLKHARVLPAEVDVLALGYRHPVSFFIRSAIQNLWSGDPKRMLREVGAFSEYAVNVVRLREWLEERGFRTSGPNRLRVLFIPHHIAHAASAYRVSGFMDANIITLDGQGEDDSGFLGYCRGSGRPKRLAKIGHHHSLGWLYSLATTACGFKGHSEEGKLMGLAAWGRPTVDMSNYISIWKDGYRLRRGWHSAFWADFGPLRKRQLGDEHRALAASVQRVTEEAGVALVRRLYQARPSSEWCFAGGVVLNCDMNMRIRELPYVKRAFFQPASNDAGTALGAALEVAAAVGEWNQTFVMDHAYWGPDYSAEEIERALLESRVSFQRFDAIESIAAHLLAAGRIIGWFQGRAEIGPRALGNRSILAHPGIPGMKDRVNFQVKHRESWRPFAPSVLHESGPDYFEDYCFAPFMILAFKVKSNMKHQIAETVHVDGTARVQSVTATTNPRFHRLISRFASLTGIPVVLNTSFNDKGEPIVCSPKDALRTFFATGLDYLILGDYLVTKNGHALQDETILAAINSVK